MRGIEQGYSPETVFYYLDRINTHLDNLTNSGILEEPVILSGSAVFLYELAYGQVKNGGGIRIPTDLDLVLTDKDFLRIMKRDILGLKLQKNVRATKWGMEYYNLLLEGSGEFPCDVMNTLNTLYPRGDPLLSGELYTFPDFSQFPNLTRQISLHGRKYRLASPGYILFYKITQRRDGVSDNGTVKQDLEDIRRILSLGIIDSEILNKEFYILTYGDDGLREKIIRQINTIGGCSIPYLDIPKPEISYEEQIKGLRDFSHTLNRVFGKENWCYSNGTALAIYAYLKGYERRITDIDVFLTEGEVDEIFPKIFFNIPFGRVRLVREPLNIHGIAYLAPQLKGRVFLLGGYPIDVDIISRSEMIKLGDGEVMTIEGSTVKESMREIVDMPVMDLELIRAIKKFSLRPPPKTDPSDLKLIDQLNS